MSKRYLSTLLALIFVAAPAAFAQKSAGHELGQRPDRLYEFDNFDSVNLMNGNLMITVPLGLAYRVGGQLEYQLQLAYNSKVWDYEVWYNADDTETVLAGPNLRSNAGVGWRLSLGQLLSPADPTTAYESEKNRGWVYEGPRGDENPFLSMLAGETTTNDNNATMMFSSASRLRMRKLSDTVREIDFPSGEIHNFQYERAAWRLKEQRDRFGNWMRVVYTYGDPADVNRATLWTISDSQGRSHSVEFINKTALSDSTWRGQVADTITVAAFGGATAVYSLAYTDTVLPFGCGHNTNQLNSPTTTTWPLLTGITQPDGSTYAFSYQADGTNCGQGALAAVTLPTGAVRAYTYRQYQIQAGRCAETSWNDLPVGIASKTASDDATVNSDDPRWDYVQTAGKQVDIYNRTQDNGCGMVEGTQWYNLPVQPRRWFRTTVLSPAVPSSLGTGVLTRTRSDHYFNAWPHDATDPTYPIGERDTGNPGVRGAPSAASTQSGLAAQADEDSADSAGRLLLTRFFAECANNDTGDCSPATGRTGRLMRTTYGAYTLLSGADLQVLGPETQASSRTVYEDDTGCGGACDTVVTNSGWNGAGQNRVTQVTSNITGTPSRTSTVQHPSWNATLLRAAALWHFGTYTLREQTDGTSTVTEETCFDEKGFLRRKRNRRGTTAATTDLLAVYEDADALGGSVDGNVSVEKYYGGDAAPFTLSSSSTCGSTITTAATYTLRHSYQNGVRSLTTYDGSTLEALDQTIDATGLVQASRDPSNLETTFTYDKLGRPQTIKPPGAAWTKIEYDLSVTPDRVRIAQYPLANTTGTGTALTESVAYYDARGYLVQEARRLPGNVWSVVSYGYDALGRKSFATVPTQSTSSAYTAPAEATKRTSFAYDDSGRPTKMTAPDGNVTTMTYGGVRAVTRTANVATIAKPDGEAAATTENYDGHGRLRSVVEPSGDAGAVTTTTYTYDVAGRLTKAVTGTQTRTFNYDGAGLLTQEAHPESGTTKYTYDARGRVLTKRPADCRFDTNYIYDVAERLLRVDVKQSASDYCAQTLWRPLKEFEFAETAESADHGVGKLRRATRYNYDLYSSSIRVSEKYIYGDAAGRLTLKTTAIEDFLHHDEDMREPEQIFEQNFKYNDLGQLLSNAYPVCLTVACGEAPVDGTAMTYSTGTLQSIATGPYDAQAGSITSQSSLATFSYHTDGSRKEVAHTNGVTDTTVRDDSGMSRPKSIMFTGVDSDCQAPAVTISPASPGVVTDSSATLTASATGTGPLAYQWYDSYGKIAGATAATYTTGALTTKQTFKVVVTSTCGTASASVTVKTCDAPTVSVSPATSSVASGSSVTLTASATGTTPSYQWSSAADGVIAGATAATYTTGALSASDKFTVAVTFDCGGTVSASATVTVCDAPAVSVAPENTSVAAGSSVTFTASATGTAPLTYQWYSTANGAIAGATAATYTTNALDASDTFTVEVTSSCGTASASAQVTVTLAAPVGLTASRSGTTNVVATWSPVSNASGYEVERRSSGGITILSVPSGTSLTDSGCAAGTTCVYRVRALTNGGTQSAFSNADLTTMLAFTPLDTTTRVSAAHFDEILNSINSIRAAVALSPFSWTQILPAGIAAPASGVVVADDHVLALRQRMNEALAAAACPTAVYTDSLTQATAIKRIHLQELRDRTQ